VRVYRSEGGVLAWLPEAVQNIPVGAVEEFVIGQTRPTAENTGATGPLVAQSGNVYIDTAGTVLENRDISGRFIVRAANVTLRNCLIRGDSNATEGDCVDATHSAVANLLLDRCTIRRDTPNERATGVIGHGYTLRRCHVYHCVDGTGVFDTANPDGDMAMLAEGCLFEATSYFNPCSYQSDNQTHNDVGGQIQGGSNITYRGCDIQAFLDPNIGTGVDIRPFAPSLAHMAAILISPNVGAVANVTIDQNWLDGGSATINISEKGMGPIQGLSITNNRFGRGSRGYYIYLPQSTLDISNVTGNVHEDDGSPVPIDLAAA